MSTFGSYKALPLSAAQEADHRAAWATLRARQPGVIAETQSRGATVSASVNGVSAAGWRFIQEAWGVGRRRAALGDGSRTSTGAPLSAASTNAAKAALVERRLKEMKIALAAMQHGAPTRTR
jgi:hypothetical protein